MLLDGLDVTQIGTSDGFCAQTAEIFQFVGWVVFILKILIPVAMIVLGIIGLGKAVIADDDKEIKTQVNRLITRFIAAVFIFFLPSLIGALFGLVNGFKEVQPDYQVCVDCVTSPKGKCIASK